MSEVFLGICDWCTPKGYQTRFNSTFEAKIYVKQKEIGRQNIGSKTYRRLQEETYKELLDEYGKPVIGLSIGAHCEYPDNLCLMCLSNLFADLAKEFVRYEDANK